MVEIEVVYAAEDRQVLLAVSVPVGTHLRAAVQASGIAARFPELDLANCPLGIFGKVVADADVRAVQAGDRIEIYRPLLVDPKEVRRLRAAKAARAKQQHP
ncbi:MULTISPECIES: RnfH family protein [unclassified Pseudomonas]|uniref:RnfH family protein n=1 Tax=unclassified Pseudomonas TaxID=196821 RepID=UPI000C869028|nr:MULTISPECIES: RnfH family protein [unclassified Pseudomonas]PMV20083.1 RnfH family protein [Pseudomonas sp. FW305-3-2-15-C-TSA2]PMV25067.1 RnfH family protein [Pseudomonas sp. DP16D-L5]PMV36766.1 RnfH family protein [Pseudomonas sp. FW305-3-2-15-A-LB2]PMV42951.1 RnfH family protein [Pseudomonas sp. FW305-3-2-15-C-R2A1]PMV48425.1 RnfH family protein [Pseudomonas sp. FW305-3-2-15-C-LB1]